MHLVQEHGGNTKIPTCAACAKWLLTENLMRLSTDNAIDLAVD